MREAASTDGSRTPRREKRERVRATCCGCISLRNAILFLSVAGFLMSLTATIFYGMRLTDHMETMTLAEVAVTGSEVAMWLWMMGIMMIGIYGVYKDISKFVEAYFWLYVVHWICDLGVMVAFLVVMFQIKSPIVRAQCAKVKMGCDAEMAILLLLITILLVAYKLFSIYICYLIFCYRSVLMINNEEEDEDRPPLIRWLARSNSNASDSSIYGKRKPWTPGRIPTIQIDFASDQSSASTYSSDSPNYRDIVYGYNKVQSPPAVHYASHVAGTGNGTINYNPGFRYDYGYTHELSKAEVQPRLVTSPSPAQSQSQPQLHPQPSHDNVPALPSYSVVGSEKGALA